MHLEVNCLDWEGAFSDSLSNIDGLFGDVKDWSKEAWANTEEFRTCIKNAGTDIEKINACRTSAGGASAATFNLFLTAGLAVLLLVRVFQPFPLNLFLNLFLGASLAVLLLVKVW